MYQNKVTFSLAAIQRPGHQADSCKMVYYTILATQDDTKAIVV